ncbi:hypothetical protein [Corynebacterium halotolerans]|uniref:hypothetical protein n=1 Tax=Corynebacterium halotolerans TaxID=225326 RepID=UPI00034A9B30|nr:hypothetical protein [Corynebacterium halotolerans]
MLEDHLYDGLDLEPLYASDSHVSNGRHHPKAGVAMDFVSWFTPLNPRQRLTPFATT